MRTYAETDFCLGKPDRRGRGKADLNTRWTVDKQRLRAGPEVLTTLSDARGLRCAKVAAVAKKKHKPVLSTRSYPFNNWTLRAGCGWHVACLGQGLCRPEVQIAKWI